VYHNVRINVLCSNLVDAARTVRRVAEYEQTLLATLFLRYRSLAHVCAEVFCYSRTIYRSICFLLSILRLPLLAQPPTQLIIYSRCICEHVIGELQRDPLPSSLPYLPDRPLDFVRERNLIIRKSGETRRVYRGCGVFEDVCIGGREYGRGLKGRDSHCVC
jgi:hypothetical protein